MMQQAEKFLLSVSFSSFAASFRFFPFSQPQVLLRSSDLIRYIFTKSGNRE